MQELNASNEEKRIQRILRDNAKTLIWVIGVVFSFIMFVVLPQQETKTNIALIQKDIAVINSNHLTHLQSYAEEIRELQQQQAKEQEKQTELMERMVKLETELNQLEK